MIHRKCVECTVDMEIEKLDSREISRWHSDVLTFTNVSMLWCCLAASARSESTASWASTLAPKRVDKYDSFGTSNSPVAFSKHGTNVCKWSLRMLPDDSISSDKVFMLSLRISGTVCVTPVSKISGNIELATIWADFPLLEAASTQIWKRKPTVSSRDIRTGTISYFT